MVFLQNKLFLKNSVVNNLQNEDVFWNENSDNLRTNVSVNVEKLEFSNFNHWKAKNFPFLKIFDAYFLHVYKI